MGKFASVYDLPGGEQLLVCVVHVSGEEPFYQISTEINGKQVSMEMPLQLKEVPDVKKPTHVAMKAMAIDYLDEMPQENVLALRKMMVVEVNKQAKGVKLKLVN